MGTVESPFIDQGFIMATTGKTPGRKAVAKKPAGGITKAKVKRVARQTQAQRSK